MRGHPGQAAQGLALHVGELARLVVDQAQGAHPVAVAQLDRRASIKPDAERAGHQRVVGKARVLAGIGHLKHRITQHRVGTKSLVTRRLGDTGQPHCGLEPLAPGIDQAEQRDRHAAQQRRRLHQRVELGLGRAVEHLQGGQRAQAAGFIGAGRGGLHGGVLSACAQAGQCPATADDANVLLHGLFRCGALGRDFGGGIRGCSGFNQR